MCDKELVLEYLYGELQPSERETFERHLASCANCRDEVNGFRATRTKLALWAPPEPDLGFEIVRRPAAERAPSAPRWRVSPVWGLAAAALVTLAVSAAIANLDVTVGSNGMTIRTGWNRATAQAPVTASVAPADVDRLAVRLKEVETQLATAKQTPTTAPASTNPVRMSDAELLRVVRQLISYSEQRQEGILARQIIQVSRDVETARRVDNDRLRAGLIQLQGTALDTSRRQRVLEDQIVRAGFQK
jgi:anti-sigma factor RsiW